MSKLFITFLALFSVFIVVGQDFFKIYPDTGEKLPKELIYPRGRQMLFSGFSPRPDLISELKASGFTCAGPTYGKQDNFIAACQKAGMPRFHRICPEGITLKVLAAKEAPDWDRIKSELKAQVIAARDDDSIAAWYIQPEELRYWHQHEYEYLKTAYKIVKENDPLKRPAWMYMPGHYTGAAMSKYTNYMDYLGKGMYTNYSGYQENRVWCRWTVGQLLMALENAESPTVPIVAPEMFRQPPEETLELIPAWVRHDVYCSLIAGARGIVVFSLAQRSKFTARDRYLPAYKEVAGELRQLGEVFLFGTYREDIKIKYLAGMEKASCIARMGKKKEPVEFPSVSFADISYHGKRYLLAVNSANEGVSVRFSGVPEKGVEVVHAVTGEHIVSPENGAFEVEFAGLEVKLFEIKEKK